MVTEAAEWVTVTGGTVVWVPWVPITEVALTVTELVRTTVVGLLVGTILM